MSFKNKEKQITLVSTQNTSSESRSLHSTQYYLLNSTKNIGMRKLALILTVGLITLFCNCNKETDAKVETITDTVFVQVHDTTIIPALVSDTTTTFIVVRHAEKVDESSESNLNADGMLRAEELKRILSNISISAIYSTPFNRTRQTVAPLASAKGVAITEYQSTKPYPQLVSEIRTANLGKAVVIVGHSNTVPDLLKELTNNALSITISSGQYDDLFMVSLTDDLTPIVTHLKYGKETP